MSLHNTIIFDNGTQTIKAGIAGEYEPRYVFNSLYASKQINTKMQKLFVGDAINNRKEGLIIKNIFRDNSGTEIDWQGLSKMYDYIINNKLQSNDYAEYSFLITEKPRVDNKKFKENRNKITSMLFETFKCNGVYFGKTTSLALFSHGLTTGVVVDSGHKNTLITPIFEGYCNPLFSMKLNYGGNTLTEFLQKLLHTKTNNPIHLNMKECEMVKKQTCYAALDFFDQEALCCDNDQPNTTMMLPDGKKMKVVKLKAERFQCVELMFQPSLFKKQNPLPITIHQSITKCQHSMHKVLFRNIVLSGGNSMIKGLQKRLLKDVTHLAPASVKVNVFASPQRKYASWIGGSLLAQQSEFKNIVVTPKMYQEIGPDSLSIRCF